MQPGHVQNAILAGNGMKIEHDYVWMLKFNEEGTRARQKHLNGTE